MDKTLVACSRAAGVVILALALLAFASSAAAAVVSVAILPFEVNAQESLDYLREGLSDMLASRLGSHEGVEVLGREQVRAALGEAGRLSAERARSVGTALGASHVVYGSLTVIGGSLSLDARLLEVEGELRSFYAEGQGLEALIPKVTELSSQIRAALTGELAVPAPALAAAPAPPVAPPAAQVVQPTPAVTAAQPAARPRRRLWRYRWPRPPQRLGEGRAPSSG